MQYMKYSSEIEIFMSGTETMPLVGLKMPELLVILMRTKENNINIFFKFIISAI